MNASGRRRTNADRKSGDIRLTQINAPLEDKFIFIFFRPMAASMQAEETQDPSTHNLIASDRVEGTPVRRPTGEKIGTIQRLMIDKLSGNVAYAVLIFGGFLGIDRRHFPIPWSRLKYIPERAAYELDLTDDELKRAPAYEADEEFDWGDRSQEILLHSYYGAPHYWDI